jgi:hypothetical protein
VAAAGACRHGEPSRLDDTNLAEGPLTEGNPTRITYNPGSDVDASWLPDGSAILYTAEQLGRPDRDWCLALLPPSGGAVRRLLCDDDLPSRDSTNGFRAAAMSSDGRLVFVRSTGLLDTPDPVGINVRERQLLIGRLDGGERTELIPFNLPWSPLANDIAQIRWAGPDAIVYRGDWHARVCTAPFGCNPVIVKSGLGLALRRLAEGEAPESLPGTRGATSVDIGDSPDEVFYTLVGDTRVYRYVLSTGVTTPVWDFGPAGVARGVQVAAGRLAAVVGGRLLQLTSSLGDPLQVDSGGALHVVELATGVETVLDLGQPRWRHPALSPDGRRLVVESFEARPDLYLFEIP